jgi:hypothetical protein
MTYCATSYDFDLPETSFIAGDHKELNFTVYTSGCSLADLTDDTISWKLAPWGETTSVLTKAGVSGSPTSGVFKVTLLSADTYSLGGKYIQQYSITTSSGSTFVPSRGVVNIVPIIV